MTYQLTVTGDTLDDVLAKLNAGSGAAPAAKSLTTDEMVEELRERLKKEGRTLVVRAERNSKRRGSKPDHSDDEDEGEGDTEDEAGDAGEDEADTQREDEAGGDEASSVSESADNEDDEAPDFEEVMEAAKAAVMNRDNAERAAKVRQLLAGFMADNPHITKMGEIKTDADRDAFVAKVQADAPELLADEDDEVPF